MRITTIDKVQLEAIAASFRCRGYHPTVAVREWSELSEQDRRWWRAEMRAHLKAGGVEVNG